MDISPFQIQGEFQSQLHDRFQDKGMLFDNRLLSYREAAKYLSISESYLRRLKGRNQIGYVPIGSRGVRFRVSSLNCWIEKKEVK